MNRNEERERKKEGEEEGENKGHCIHKFLLSSTEEPQAESRSLVSGRSVGRGRRRELMSLKINILKFYP